jgi:hypothetical protein
MPLSPASLLIATRQSRRADATVDIADGVAHLDSLTNAFQSYFVGQGYRVEEAIRITDRRDPTVRFIGAPISVLKPYFMQGNIPKPGICMVQNCIRTRNLKGLFDLTVNPRYGSFFTGLCVLVKYEHLSDICRQTCGFLQTQLGLDPTEIGVNINSEDTDLMTAIDGMLPASSIHRNKKDAVYYRHKYGLEGVWGRNFNFSIKNPVNGEFDDIGNVIIIESAEGQLGVELALGDTTIMRQMYGLAHIQDIYGLGIPLKDPNEALQRKLEDSIITCLALYREGLRPSALNTQTRILRSYIKALSMYYLMSGMTIHELGGTIETAEKEKLPFADRKNWQDIIDWIEEYQYLLEDGPRHGEDASIAALIAEFTATKQGSHHAD